MMLSYTDPAGVLNFCNIEDAVEMECAANFEDAGQIEATIENVVAMARTFGRLLTHLHSVGVIGEDVLLNDILQGGYEKCAD